MTTDEIKRVLAERDGMLKARDGYSSSEVEEHVRETNQWQIYINSKDAIGRVLEKLTEEEWNRFISLPCLGKESFRGTWAQFYLTLPTEVLARCVAEAIKPSAT